MHHLCLISPLLDTADEAIDVNRRCQWNTYLRWVIDWVDTGGVYANCGMHKTGRANAEKEKTVDTPNITGETKAHRLGWLGHLRDWTRIVSWRNHTGADRWADILLPDLGIL